MAASTTTACVNPLCKTQLKSITYSVSSASTVRLRVYDDAYARLEKLFMVFGAILLAAVVLSVAVFCFSLCVSWSTCITHVHACTHIDLVPVIRRPCNVSLLRQVFRFSLALGLRIPHFLISCKLLMD